MREGYSKNSGMHASQGHNLLLDRCCTGILLDKVDSMTQASRGETGTQVGCLCLHSGTYSMSFSSYPHTILELLSRSGLAPLIPTDLDAIATVV